MSRVTHFERVAQGDSLRLSLGPAKSRSRLKLFLILVAALLCLALLWCFSLWAIGSYRVLSDDPTVWQSSIDKLNAENQSGSLSIVASEEPTLFVGSSSIRLFNNFEERFHSNHVIKKGFGGAKINDVAYYQEDLIFQYAPKLVVFYIGINDILYRDHNRVTELSADLFSLTETIRSRLPNTKIALLALRPMDQPKYANPIREFNIHLANYALQKPDVFYVDINHELLSADATMNTDLLHWDGLHLNRQGYQVWGDAIYHELLAQHLIQ